MNYKIILLGFFIFLTLEKGISQNKFYTEIGYQYGHVFPTNPFLKGLNPELEKIIVYQAGNFRFGVQTDTTKLWYNLHKQPSYGVQLYVASFFEPDFIGTPIVFSGFFKGPFVKSDRFEMGYDFSLQ